MNYELKKGFLFVNLIFPVNDKTRCLDSFNVNQFRVLNMETRIGNKKTWETLSSKGETFMGGAIVIRAPLEGGESGWIEFNATGVSQGSSECLLEAIVLASTFFNWRFEYKFS